MKKGLQKWITHNKKVLIVFGVVSFIMIVITGIEVNLILSSTNDLHVYATTGVVSNELRKISILGLFNGAIIAFWVIIFSFIFLKMIFPNHKTVKNAFFFDELSFLKDMPNQLKKGLDRNE
ncbi:hypothetical protein [Lysinibacillus xylanilyticus]|uniref:hypothetical protein n=1 Tax=Lysinibacillus xylanilyticus TaxID=582475 RepID=UPI003D027EC5